jgi:hypothetical protein
MQMEDQLSTMPNKTRFQLGRKIEEESKSSSHRSVTGIKKEFVKCLSKRLIDPYETLRITKKFAFRFSLFSLAF